MLFYKALAQVMKRTEDKAPKRKPRAQPTSKRVRLRENTARMTKLQKDLDSVNDGFREGLLDLSDLIID